MISKIQRNLRVILAIAAKDIVDAIKNKSILSQVFTVVFIVVLYQFMPLFSNGDASPRLVLYDMGSSEWVADLEDSSTFDLVVATSQTAMEDYIENRDAVVLGLILPSDFDMQTNSGDEIELEGYVIHWASDPEISDVRVFFEEELSALTDSSIRIRTEGNIVYTKPDSRGMAFLVSLTAVLVMLIAGIFIVPLLMLEEKQSKTMDALLVSPASPGLVILGKALSGSIYCLIAVGVVLALNHNLVTQWDLAILAIFCGGFLSVGLGLLLGSIFEVKQQLTIWGFVVINILGIPLFLSLMDEILPASFTTLIRTVPTVALMKMFRVSFSNSAPWNVLEPELAIVFGSAVLVLAAAIWIVRRSER